MEDLTNEIVEKHGFKRINNSMWRLGTITLQNGYINNGGSLYEKILTTEKAFKVCWNGKYFRMISTVGELVRMIKLNNQSYK